MRLIRLVPAAVILCIAAPCLAQEWIEYYSRSDAFLVNFPKQPQVRDISYPSEFGLTLPAHLHIYQEGGSSFSVTVIDYSNVVALHAERVKGCTAYPDQCTNQGNNELRGALEYAVWNFLKRDGKVTYYAYANSDRIEGRRVQLVNPDKSRTFGAIYMHLNRVYILEATVPANAPPPALFQQSMGFLDKDGVRVRYADTYSNAYPAPARVPGGPNRPMGCE
ncbi:MAG TPA: hypothetical protein VGJ78_05515 [Vicinamibacterales bacterium]|jgi:hypothetical protein